MLIEVYRRVEWQISKGGGKEWEGSIGATE